VNLEEALRIRASLGFGFMAALFVMEAETWPVFLEWAKGQEAQLLVDRTIAAELLEELFKEATSADLFVEVLEGDPR
jgi:hypothetical protein